ncbi:MAG: hypothetical protein JWL59_1439 [Chthoniobacteraceae bacterium]|nr:hypothetical protein [Chthoniobacteraceae bacterium]
MKNQLQPLRALLVEDSEADALLLVEALRRGGYRPDWHRVETEPALRAALLDREWDVVFCDYSMPELDAMSALRIMRETGDMLTAIVISGQVGEEVAVEAMRMGANDFVLRENFQRLAPAVDRELRAAELRRERQTAALALRESEERYRALFDKSPWPMWVYDAETFHYLAVNERAVKDYGYTREEYLRLTVGDLHPSEEMAAWQEYFGQTEVGVIASLERTWRHQKKDGSVIMVEIANQPIVYHGEVARVVQAIDITARKQAEEALRESEERFRGTFEKAAVGIAHVSTEGRFLQVNDKLCGIVGYGREEMLDMTFNDLTLPEDRLAGQEANRAMLAGDLCSYTAEKRYRHKQGETLWISLVTTLERSAERGPKYFISVFEDITTRKLAQEAVHKSEREQRKLATALETERARLVAAQAIAKVGSWEADLSTQLLIWSDETYRIFETASDQFEPTNESLLRLVHPEDRVATEQAVVRSLDGQSPCTTEYRLLMSDGRIKFVQAHWQIVRDDRGTPMRAIGTCQDITEAKHDHDQIREQAALLDHARDAILVQDLDGRIKYWNKSAERVFGWTSKEVLGNKVQDLLHESLNPYEAALKGTLSEDAWIGEMTKRTKTHCDVLIEGRWTLMRNEAGEPTAILAINTDITEKKKIEAQFFRAQRMESIGALAGGIAHDLNNVFAPMIMGVDLLKLRVTDPENCHLLEVMETCGQRGADLIKQVLYFARGLEGNRELISLRRVMDELQRMACDTFPKSISVEANVPEGTWNILGDATQLHQVLLNLCVNARDAMPRGGELRITARNRQIDEQFAAMHSGARSGPYVMLEVADTGEGIPPKIMERIFEPFFTTKEIGKGTGLGLSTTMAIVRNHGGFMTVESKLGVGTLFQINLPAETSSTQMQAERVALELPRGKGEIILIIDDEVSIRSIIGQTLETFGYQIMSADDGAGGIAKYAQHAGEIAVVITDMMMPVMDGGAVIRVLMRINPEVKIIAASGSINQQVGTDVAGLVKRFLPKPYTAETLLIALHKVLHPESRI